MKNFRICLDSSEDERVKPIEYFTTYRRENGKITQELLTTCNINTKKCHKMIYEKPVKDIKDIPKSIRIGAMFDCTDPDEISYILGDDIFSNEEKERLLNRVREVNEKIENGRIDELEAELEEEMKKDKENGVALDTNEVVKEMLEEDIDYDTISAMTGKSIEEIREIGKTNTDES